MRKVATVIVPWLVWGALDQLIYLGLLSASPDSFGDDSLPVSAGVLGSLLALRAVYSIVAGYIAAKIAGSASGSLILAAATLLLTTGIVVQALSWSGYPIWYSLGFILSIVPCALLGARLGGKKS